MNDLCFYGRWDDGLRNFVSHEILNKLMAKIHNVGWKHIDISHISARKCSEVRIGMRCFIFRFCREKRCAMVENMLTTFCVT